jgi:hypothetical protein
MKDNVLFVDLLISKMGRGSRSLIQCTFQELGGFKLSCECFRFSTEKIFIGGGEADANVSSKVSIRPQLLHEVRVAISSYLSEHA